jgi:hypothetical protein
MFQQNQTGTLRPAGPDATGVAGRVTPQATPGL